MKLLLFAASLRKEALNKKLITISENIAKELGTETHLADFAEFSAPLYNQDIQTSTGFPAEINHFVKLLQETDGLIISSPEYNFSTPGTLKNLIDWVSRLNPMPWKNRPILLMSASLSLVGGNRGLWATRVPLECCGALVHPNMFSLSAADKAFDDHGQLLDKNLEKHLKQNIADFLPYAKALKDLA
jgi:chromate reductase